MADDRFLVLPFMGTSVPTVNMLVENGIAINTGVYWGCYNPSGNTSYVVISTLGSGGINTETCAITPTSGYRIAYAASNSTVTTREISYVVVAGSHNYYTYNTGFGSSGTYPVAFGAVGKFPNLNSAVLAASKLSPPEGSMNIKYAIQNGSVIGPSWIAPGGNVTSYVTMQAGFSLTQQDISVTRNGTAIPFAYSNGVLTFTAPSQSG